ncbi:hypothetical protein EVAR_78079_1 [Eumeta japonica]|uniref:Proton-coupled folate transporter n=1 Tax=Eumeta variegata TaxID=151549 RepID=A0A4C1T179_EUMVA|nr:hypothetical protein EVAR_78079_1 [Eumeta japonica]
METGCDETSNKKPKYRPTMEIPLFMLMFGVYLSGCVKRLTLLGRGNRKRQSESECVVLERMRVVYLLQASASVAMSNVQYSNARGRETERYTKVESRREKESNVVTNILLYRTCLHVLNYPDSQCSELLYPGERSNETMELEAEVQQYLSMVTMMHSVSGAVVPTILSLFLGAWSDKYGRKPLIMWPLLGMSLTSYLLVGFAALNGLGPWWYLLTVIPFSFSGGYSALFTGSFCYMADISTEKDRSFRISLMEAGLLFGTVIGTLASPYLVRVLGNVPLLIVVASAYTLAFVYVLFSIKESVKKATQGSIRSLFDFALIKDLVRTCVKKRPNKRRRILFLLTICCALSVTFTASLDYLYTRNKLQWSLDIYAIYAVVNTLTAVIGLILGVTVLQKLLKVNDIWLTMLSYVSSVADNVIRAFAVVSWHMYLATSVSLFRGLAQPILRSILSKILPVEDLAKIFTLQSVLNVTLPMLAPLVFNPLYSATLTVFPGSIYIVCAGINIATIFVLSFAHAGRLILHLLSLLQTNLALDLALNSGPNPGRSDDINALVGIVVSNTKSQVMMGKQSPHYKSYETTHVAKYYIWKYPSAPSAPEKPVKIPTELQPELPASGNTKMDDDMTKL